MSEPTRAGLFVWVKGENEYVEKRATDADLAAMGYVKLEGIDVEALRSYVARTRGIPASSRLNPQMILARQVLAALDGRTDDV